jgi:hypothetical protein
MLKKLIYLQDYTAEHPKRQQSAYIYNTPTWNRLKNYLNNLAENTLFTSAYY